MLRVPARTLVAAGFATLALAGAGCMDANMMAEVATRGGDVRYDPATGNAYRLYQYFPESEVYHSVYDYTWYWQDDGGRWKRGPRLPESVVINDLDYEFVELPTSRPYGRHEDVVAMHPGSELLKLELARLDAQWEHQQMERQLQQDEQPTAIASVPTD